jgi:hypothetical protein
VEKDPSFNQYMDRYFDFEGQWDCPSKCGLKVIQRKDNKVVVIATELYRQNPGTPVTEWCAPLATQLLKSFARSPDDFIFIEHTPDVKSKLAFYEETFDLINFDWCGERFSNPRWTRLVPDQVNQIMDENTQEDQIA